MDPTMSEEAALPEAWRKHLRRIRLIDTLTERMVARGPRLNQVLQILSDPWYAAITNRIRAKFVITMSEGEMDPTMSEEAVCLLAARALLFALQEAWREPVGRIRLIDRLAKEMTARRPLMNDMQRSLDLDPQRVAIVNRSRAKFVKELRIGPPKHFRVIDCRRTIKKQQVVLIDWHRSQVAYTAVSHTFGMDVYGVFDCECASKCDAEVPARCSRQACRGHDVGGTHAKIVKDILNMCVRLRSAGAEYVWHDGVCIAQHDEAEVRETIQRMGWIYGHAKETVIFLHYVGNPIAPIRHDGDLISRWVTRAWTLQEAALSARRRYCLRRCGDLRHCQNLKQFEAEIAHCYEDDSTVTVVEEDAYLALLNELLVVLSRLVSQAMLQINNPVSFLFKSWQRIQSLCDSTSASSDHTRTTIPPLYSLLNLSSKMRDAMNLIVPSLDLLEKSQKWLEHLIHLTSTCMDTCWNFPTVEAALSLGSFRDSKHEGDRLNSILALAGVRDFVAPKDGNMASSTIEFFERQGQDGLGRAVFSVNLQGQEEDSWVPCLSGQLQPIQTDAARSSLRQLDPNGSSRMIQAVGTADYIQYEVLRNGMIQLSGDLACLSVEFTFMAGRRKNRRGRSDQSVMHMHLYSVISVCLAGFTAYRGHANMGRAEMTVHNYRPIIKGHEVEDGESFRVHLLYPVPALHYIKANKVNTNFIPGVSELCNSVPALLIQGDLEAGEAVSKVGHFYVFPALQKILLANNRTTAITRLERLVLK